MEVAADIKDCRRFSTRLIGRQPVQAGVAIDLPLARPIVSRPVRRGFIFIPDKDNHCHVSSSFSTAFSCPWP
ncbi:hypothetical protein, partial [Pseudomonas viridiflava]|uniref:hypothetical protein n=1 Tax=Pseudomonas viridiflava TaxID=33069 RepID=UPI0019675CE8